MWKEGILMVFMVGGVEVVDVVSGCFVSLISVTLEIQGKNSRCMKINFGD